MKNGISLFLIFVGLVCYSQQPSSASLANLKKEILSSKEASDWQKTMIYYHKSNSEFCALKNEQSLNKMLFISCGKPSPSKSYKEFTLKLFRTMRVRDELRDSVFTKEKILRATFPQLATHFFFDEIYPELYAPIEEARKKYQQSAAGGSSKTKN